MKVRHTLTSSVGLRRTQNPLVSVVCPTRNGSAHLAKCIESVLTQDYEAVELIVVDGASTDETLSILDSYAEQLRYVSEPDSGQGEAINKGLALARGDILCWLNSDDEYVPGAISAAVEAFHETGADIIYGDALAVDGRGRRYGHRINVVQDGDFTRLVHHKCFVVQPASFWTREVWDQAGPLDQEMHYALDYDFFMRATADFTMSYWPYTFAIERLHSGAKTFLGQRKRIEEIRQAATQHGAHDMPLGFRAEAAGVYLADAARLLKRGDLKDARRTARQAAAWSQQVSKSITLVYFATSLVAQGRFMPKLRLLSNFVISRRRADDAHENPPMRRHSPVTERNAHRLRRAMTSPAKGGTNRLLYKLGPRLGVLTQHSPRPLRHRPPPPPADVGELPTMTVVTPSYNQGDFLQATIDSVLDQRYPNLEYFVQDGGSEDNSVDILQSNNHPALRWQSAKDGGQSNAINLGHAKGTGEIMAWLNSDDIFLPGVLAYVGAFFSANPQVDVVYSHRVLIDDKGDEIGRWLLPGHDSSALTWADYVPQETMFWRRRIWNEVGGIDESFRFAMDWDLLLRFEDAGANIVRLPIFGGGFRVYDEQLTSSVIESVGADEMRRLRRRCHGRDVSQSEIARALVPYFARHLALDRAYQAGIVKY